MNRSERRDLNSGPPAFAQTQRAVIRDRTVGYARKFVQNPVTAIVKEIESRDLVWRPGYRLPYAMGGRGRILPKRRDRRSLWLRPRDVRTDDGVRRPREMRRSCQLKAVGSSEDSDSLYLVTDEFCSGGTTKQPNTHNTESREVLYPWHAWHGRSVWIHQAMVKNGVAIFHCGLEQAVLRLLQVPQWMFDRTIFRGMHLARHSQRIEPMILSAYGFCHGERGAVRTF